MTVAMCEQQQFITIKENDDCLKGNRNDKTDSWDGNRITIENLTIRFGSFIFVPFTLILTFNTFIGNQPANNNVDDEKGGLTLVDYYTWTQKRQKVDTFGYKYNIKNIFGIRNNN
ncbi:hypothetical protein DFA_00295 [Cavenderia fasciculata]|uniref:Uncharacterized protein n=1 Tax=Cavenderia fasciculata TaxID=261658 RepID=F4PY57_CACFS|nr:uncharacterized protein DFA_00295 [Cavenderia fasciculata]EGG19717.1 hypothetical protein DFA_00295 [Cavenderia fasciculata]|eukprot:XP_004358011.1 hypothetical protein DFA_00295 [Cavenderia fasciculata]